jgi:hypothetical protein
MKQRSTTTNNPPGRNFPGAGCLTRSIPNEHDTKIGSECGGSNPAVRLGGCTVIGTGVGAAGGAILTGDSPVGVVGGAVVGGVIGHNM